MGTYKGEFIGRVTMALSLLRVLFKRYIEVPPNPKP